ncbi:MAG: hypothetical protein DRQ60_07940 [Gammaproteobacteria bacterium]|nr:MAG: hypothetical protein DRQ54_07820 [Gammaproteobacteria bacterium]RLA13075.1 MAG: hypothetical protein DRQ60_07940 [Gammaproteobacteria bacterium]RLA13418.1 MAG: hypothetical protein DRQ52_06280 [Gammaproteobacteria bacterium]
MQKHLPLFCLTISAALWVPYKVWAHHAFSAEFDSKSPVTLQGTVTKVEWINPHAWVHLAVEQEDGTVIDWMVEAGTPNTLLRAGINKNSLPIGSEIVVRGYQSKDRSCKPACKANGRDMAFSDGRKVFMGSSGTGAPKDGLDPRDR